MDSMHTIQLKVDDTVYDHILFLLKSLKPKGVIIEKDIHEDGIDFSQYTVQSFQQIKDPVKWQNEIRDEWQ
jgi:hypothetical protein